MSEPIRVLTVDDHPLLREGIAAVLANEPDVCVVGDAEDGPEAILRHRALQPDVTLMDVQLPGLDGIETTARILAESPRARILVLTMYAGDALAARAMAAGAAGYLLKSALRADLVDAIRAVHAGRRRVPAEVALAMAEHHGEEALTGRELEVLALVARGGSNRNVAIDLGIGEETVKTHVRNILGKLAAHDRTHAVSIALKRGILRL